MEGTDSAAEAAKAYAEITSQLEAWTSPHVGTFKSSSSYKMDVDDNNSDYEEEGVMHWIQSSNRSDVSNATPQKRPSEGTSKARYSAKKQQTEPSPLALSLTDDMPDSEDMGMNMEHMDDIDSTIIGVQSPWVQRTSSSRSGMSAEGSNEVLEYRRYHDALLTYLGSRRNISECTRIQEEEAQLSLLDPREQVHLAHEEMRGETDFLAALSGLCLDRLTEKDTNEGNLWSLIATLRSLGMKSLLLEDGPSQKFHQRQEIESVLQKLASQTEKTPSELLDSLEKNDAPLILRRRKLLLEWMENCQEMVLSKLPMPPSKQTTMWPASLTRLQRGQMQGDKVQSLHPDAPLLVQEAKVAFSTTSSSPLHGEDESADAILLKSCLALILSGQLDTAMDLCRQCGQSWRAAAWGGGTPHGIRTQPNRDTQLMEKIEAGNPHRALWKRQCWKMSQMLAKKKTAVGTSTQYESAIYSFLADNTTAALSNPALDPWERGLQAVISAMMGRVEDDLFYRHNKNRRAIGKQFPFMGTEHEMEEKEQLECTSSLENVSEADVFELLASRTDYNDPLRAAMESFIIGKTAVSQYITDEGSHMDETDVAHLRFLTHLTLYIDSLSASASSAIVLPGTDMSKNTVLLQYVRHLASRPDLWRILALYASLLPTETLMECYPTLLCRVEGDAERRGMLQDARELFAPGLDLVIVKRVVRTLLSEGDDSNRADERKMKAIMWLCYHEEHMGDALVCANSLLRQFVLNSKLKCAFAFLEKFLPENVVETVIVTARAEDCDGDVSMNNLPERPLFKNSLAEHGALQSYLQANRAFEEWREVLKKTSSIATDVAKFKSDSLTRIEMDIAESMERREMIIQKRRAGQAVVEAADAAREKLSQVLTYPGGFLNQDNESCSVDSEEDVLRREQLVALRSLCLPRAVFLLQSVCDDTAAWMASFLQDAIPSVGSTRFAALSALDDVENIKTSPLSPTYWLDQSLSLVETVAMDAYAIYEAFGTKDLRKFLSLMAEMEVKNLRYSAVESVRDH